MRSLRSICTSALLLALGAAGPAWAQACCAGASLLSPARLTPHEDAIVALELRNGVQVGSLDGRGAFHGNAAGSGELDFTQSLIGTLRVLREGQLTAIVPVTQSVRWVPGLRDAGGFLGDVSLSFRYDFLLAGESARWPGLALLAGLSFPTGRSPEQARTPLGADTTGTGLWQGTVGLAVEQTVGHVFLQGTGLVQQRLPRRVGTLTELLGTSFSLGLAAGWVFDSGGAVAATFTTIGSLPAWIDGVQQPDTARWRNTFGASAAFPLSDTWRLQGALTTQLPFGVNEQASTTLSLLLMRTWS